MTRGMGVVGKDHYSGISDLGGKGGLSKYTY